MVHGWMNDEKNVTLPILMINKYIHRNIFKTTGTVYTVTDNGDSWVSKMIDM